MGHAARLTPKYIAIARVSSDSHVENDVANFLTLSFPIAAGDDRLLIGSIYKQSGSFTSFTYDTTQNFTQDNTKADPSNANNVNFIFSLVAPNTGTNDATYTKGDATGLIVMCLANYTGAKQTSQPDSIGSASSASASGLSYTVTTVADDCWIMTVVNNLAGGTITDGSNFVQLEVPSSTNGVFGDSNASVGAAGGKTVAMTGGSARWWACSAAYAPAAAAAPSAVTIPNLLLMGAG